MAEAINDLNRNLSTVELTFQALSLVIKEHARVIYTIYADKVNQVEKATEQLLMRQKAAEQRQHDNDKRIMDEMTK